MEPRTEMLPKVCHASAHSDDRVPWASADATDLLLLSSSLGRESSNRDTVSGTRCDDYAASNSNSNSCQTSLPIKVPRLPFLSSLSRDNFKRESGYQHVLGSAESTIGEKRNGEENVDDDISKKDVSRMKLHLLLSEHKRIEAADRHRIHQGRGEGMAGERNKEYEEQQKRASQRRAILLPAVPQTLPEPEELTVGIPKERVVVRNDFLGLYSQHENVIDLEKLIEGGRLTEKEGEQRSTGLSLTGDAGENHGGQGASNDANRTETGYRGSGIVPLRGMGGLRSMRETSAEDEEQMKEINQRTTSCTASPNIIFVKDTFHVKVPTANSVVMCPLMKSTESEGDPFSLSGAVERTGRHRSRRSRQETVVEFRHCWCSSHFLVSLVICMVLGVMLCLLFGPPLS